MVYIYLKCPPWRYMPLVSLPWSCSWIPNGLLVSKASLRKALSWIIWGYRVITASDVYIDKMVRVCIWGALCNSFLPWCEWLALVFCTGEELDSFADLTALENNKSVVPRAVLFFSHNTGSSGRRGQALPLAAFGNILLWINRGKRSKANFLAADQFEKAVETEAGYYQEENCYHQRVTWFSLFRSF